MFEIEVLLEFKIFYVRNRVRKFLNRILVFVSEIRSNPKLLCSKCCSGSKLLVFEIILEFEMSFGFEIRSSSKLCSCSKWFRVLCITKKEGTTRYDDDEQRDLERLRVVLCRLTYGSTFSC